MEWHVEDAYLEHESGLRFSEFKKNNLHLVNFSYKINKFLSLEQLKKNIYTNITLKKAIPYVTSYYKKTWGFCMSYLQYKQLPKGKYVYISSEHKRIFRYIHAKLMDIVKNFF